jgi:MarR family transcriptional regulator, lower aerobic nicotinate degradation pathway regulator
MPVNGLPIFGRATQDAYTGWVTESSEALPGVRRPGALLKQTSYLLVKLAGMLSQECADALAPAGLTQREHAVLCCLEEFGPAFQKDVASHLALDSGDLVAVFDKLQADGYLSRVRDSSDRRRRILELTAAGRQVLRRVERILADPEETLYAALSPAERQHLHHLVLAMLTARDPAAWPAAAPALKQSL